MSQKPETYVAAVLLTTGEVDYRMPDKGMAEALTHPRTRLGVLAFYGHYTDSRRITSGVPCPVCGALPQDHRSVAEWGFRNTRPPVFVCEGIAYRCKEKDPNRLQRALDPWGSPKNETRWEITTEKETSALLDNRRVQWILDDWLERNA